jgi:ribosomal protein S18 acetylase RimI-like enzyme
VHRQDRRQGYGAEAVAALVGWARARGAPALRLGVDEGNAVGLAFWQSLGFRVLDHRERLAAAGQLAVTVLELRLDARHA